MKSNHLPSLMLNSLLALVLLLLAACQQSMPPVAFHADGRPAKLSDWHLVEAHDGKLALNAGVTAYDLNTPTFTDYAHKLRTIWMPTGSSAKFVTVGPLNFPVGTVITQTLYYPRVAGGTASEVARTLSSTAEFAGQGLDLAKVRLIETRLLVRRQDGWTALPYVWNEAQTDATLARTGAILPLTLVAAATEAGAPAREDFNYVVPDDGQCTSCHTSNMLTRAIQPIGLEARHVNKSHDYGDGAKNQLQHLADIGYLSGLPALTSVPHDPDWRDTTVSVDARARAYLDINCAMCHSPTGVAAVTGTFFGYYMPEGNRLGLCKTPEAAGPATGGRLFDIVPGKPDESIMIHRMASTRPGVMMPEIGRSTVDREGEALIRSWILSLKGHCDIVR